MIHLRVVEQGGLRFRLRAHGNCKGRSITSHSRLPNLQIKKITRWEGNLPDGRRFLGEAHNNWTLVPLVPHFVDQRGAKEDGEAKGNHPPDALYPRTASLSHVTHSVDGTVVRIVGEESPNCVQWPSIFDVVAHFNLRACFTRRHGRHLCILGRKLWHGQITRPRLRPRLRGHGPRIGSYSLHFGHSLIETQFSGSAAS